MSAQVVGLMDEPWVPVVSVRRCESAGCGTVLRASNRGTHCSVHQAARLGTGSVKKTAGWAVRTPEALAQVEPPPAFDATAATVAPAVPWRDGRGEGAPAWMETLPRCACGKRIAKAGLTRCSVCRHKAGEYRERGADRPTARVACSWGCGRAVNAASRARGLCTVCAGRPMCMTADCGALLRSKASFRNGLCSVCRGYSKRFEVVLCTRLHTTDPDEHALNQVLQRMTPEDRLAMMQTAPAEVYATMQELVADVRAGRVA